MRPPIDLPPRTPRQDSRRLLLLASAIFAAGLMGGIMIMVDASGSAEFPAGDASRTWRAEPNDLVTQPQVMAAAGSGVSPTVSPATDQFQASTPMRQVEQPLSTALLEASEEPVPDTRHLSGLSWLRSLVAMYEHEPGIKAGDTSRSARTLNVRSIASAGTPAHVDTGALDANRSDAPFQAPGTSGMSKPSRVGLDPNLIYVDMGSQAYTSFKSWVDSAVNGNRGYGFAASEAAIMFQLTANQNYCTLAVTMVEEQVARAEAAIEGGGRPDVAGDSYLQVGPMIADLSLTLHVCSARVTSAQRTRWSAYAEQAVWNVWHPSDATWGGRSFPWSGWSTSNPGNNYYYSFVEATMYWALASGNSTWMNLLRNNKLPALQAYFAKLPGGGSLEGTGYGTSHMRLFWLYQTWRDATGIDLGNANSHATDSIHYWIHATVPTLDYFAPLGDQARVSVPEIYDYQRRLMLEARYITNDTLAREHASWWLNNISVQHMNSGFNRRYDLLPAGNGGTSPTELLYHAKGTGNLFARSDWSRTAMWVAFSAGAYNEDHAHQEQGGFTLFADDWLAVTENIWSHSGIQQGTETHNVVRFENGGRVIGQCAPSTSSMTVTPGGDGAFSATANLTPAYCGNAAVRSWQRKLDFAQRKLTVRDTFSLGTGTTATFQVNVPVQPTVNGREASAGRLHLRVLQPANATLNVRSWNSIDSGEYGKGWRIDVSGGSTGYVVELYEN